MCGNTGVQTGRDAGGKRLIKGVGVRKGVKFERHWKRLSKGVPEV